MTYPPESKWNQLRNNAIAYYEATIFPSTASDFDSRNPKPRQVLERELERINIRARKEGEW